MKKFSFNLDLDKIANSFYGLVFSFILDLALLALAAIEIYTGDSNAVLMLILGMYLIDSAYDTWVAIKDLKSKNEGE